MKKGIFFSVLKSKFQGNTTLYSFGDTFIGQKKINICGREGSILLGFDGEKALQPLPLTTTLLGWGWLRGYECELILQRT